MKKLFHKTLVAIALITGSLYLSFGVENVILFYDIPELAATIVQLLTFILILRQTVYKTEFRYKD